MHHKVRGFYSFKGHFLHVDIRICEYLIQSLPERDVMELRSDIQHLFYRLHDRLTDEKIVLEECAEVLDEMIKEDAKTKKET